MQTERDITLSSPGTMQHQEPFTRVAPSWTLLLVGRRGRFRACFLPGGEPLACNTCRNRTSCSDTRCTLLDGEITSYWVLSVDGVIT